MESMLRRFNLPLLITALAMVLLCVAMLALRHAAPEIAAAVILVLVVIAGAGVGASLTPQSPRH